MSDKSPTKKSPKGAIKILNDNKNAIIAQPVKPMISVPLSPTKQVNMSIAKMKNAPTKKNMDHYVLKTIKNESKTVEGEEVDEETFEYILNDEPNDNAEICGPSGEITEELHLSGEEGDEDGKTEEIVEHMCGKCYKTFRRISGLKKHLDFCRFDSGYHLRKAEMLKNLSKIENDAVVMENKDICFCCGESYDTFHLGHINCPDCPKSFKTQMSYERHIFITHSENNDYPCTICNAKLRSEKLLQLHLEQHQNRGKPFACKICGKDFTRSYHLKRHQKYSSCSANEADSMSCKVCGKVFYRLDNLRAHLKIHLGTLKTKKIEYMCPTCKNCFYSLSTLNIHTRTHTGERPFDCDLCEKKFPSLVALKKHRRYHTGEKPYTCSVCSQSFAVKEVLNRHMKRHTGERPHVCSECGKSFIQATQLRSHAKTHLRPFECKECKEKFKTAKQLDRHARCHNKRGRKAKSPSPPELKCTDCDAKFKRTTQLESHMLKKHKKHLGRTDCAICDKDFDSPKSLNFHILKVHEVDPAEIYNEKPSKLTDVNENTEDESSQLPPSKIIKLDSFEIASGIEIITPDNEGENEMIANSSNEASTVTDVGNGIVVQEFIVDEILPSVDKKSGSFNENSYTVIPLDSDDVIMDDAVTAVEEKPKQTTTESKKTLRKSLGQSLAEAIASDGDDDTVEKKVEDLNEEDLKLKDNVEKLLDMLVDKETLKKFGWPGTNEEKVLCKVIENCGHDFSKDAENYKEYEYATRMREYVKLLFTVVIHNDSIKTLLNNYPIDEVIEYVLGNDDDDDDDEGEDEGKSEVKGKGDSVADPVVDVDADADVGVGNDDNDTKMDVKEDIDKEISSKKDKEKNERKRKMTTTTI